MIPTIFMDTDGEGAVFRARSKAGASPDSVVVRYRQDGRVATRERTWLALVAERRALLGLMGR